MTAADRHTWVEHLGADECWRLLAAAPVGRLGVINNSGPEIYPVNHAVDGHSIIFRTDPSSMLAALSRTPAVCFQIDGIDLAAETGWSVLVKGRASELVDTADLRRAAALRLRYWSLGDKEHWVRIDPAEVTGRRIWHSQDEDPRRPPR
jgi:nitroimidazol reductase NimA-like FMN-containing flavoprotein (pyridoxamine 5'-phosphate oxidase superfamily)